MISIHRDGFIIIIISSSSDDEFLKFNFKQTMFVS